jgi:POT family proton-dependent oligopeptide transporter
MQVQEVPVEPVVASPGGSGFAAHPRALKTLFFTEMWERFSFYGMRAILLLYMVAPLADGGMGLETAAAASVYGTYTMAVYLSAIPGGLVADRFLGARRAVLFGAIVIALGHFAMALASVPAFYGGLALIVVGTGLLKPNISTMVGNLYAEGDPRRDSGFSIFYMGINLGAALSPLVCGYLAQSDGFKQTLASFGLSPAHSWHWGFAAAGVGMTLGLVQYLVHRERLADVGARPAPRSGEAAPKQPLTRTEWMRIAAIFVFFTFTILFWSVYEQAGSSLTLFADRLTRNEIFGWEFPSSWFQSVEAVFVIALAPIFSIVWLRFGSRQPSSPAKFSAGLAFLGIGTALMIPAAALAGAGKVSPLWLVGVYFLHVVGEMCLSPVGLSTVTKLAPARLVGMMMGVWFLATALGNKVAADLGGLFDEKDTGGMQLLFGAMAVGVLVAAGVLALLAPAVRKMMGGVR